LFLCGLFSFVLCSSALKLAVD